MGASQVKESLYTAIEQSDEVQVAQILQKYPDLLNTTITDDCKSTALSRSVWRNDKKLVKLLLEMGCQIEYKGDRGITPLMWAAKRGHIEMAKFLIEKGAQIDTRSTDENKFTSLEQAITVGQYEMCLYLFSLDVTQAEKLQIGEVYREAAKGKYLSYCNYEQFLDHLKARVPFESCPNFFKRPPEPELADPVIDPRETWGQFFKRTLEFEEPPMVERSELPEHLQPQNRFMGKVRAYLNGQTPYPANQKKSSEEIQRQNIEMQDPFMDNRVIDQNKDILGQQVFSNNQSHTQFDVNKQTKETTDNREINL